MFSNNCRTGHVVQSVTYLTADACLATDAVIASLIPAWSHTFGEINHETTSSVILHPSADSRRVVVIYFEMADLLDLLYVMFPCVFCHFPIWCQVWNLIVLITDICPLVVSKMHSNKEILLFIQTIKA